MDQHAPTFKSCSRCESLPSRAEATGELYLWLPLGHSIAKLLPFLMELENHHELRTQDQCLTVTLSEDHRASVLEGLSRLLSPEEQADTKALFLSAGQAPTLRDYANVTSLAAFLKAQEANWLIDLLSEERFTSYFQPIVHTQDTSRVFGNEALLRGFDENGGLVPPHRIFSLAQATGMLFQVDLQARRSAIRQAAHLASGQIFINFNPSSIYDATFCLRSTLALIDQLGLDRRRVVFEVVESDHVKRPEHLASILNYYREQGFQVALDDLGAGYSSLNLVHQLRPDYIKLDMAMVRDVHQDPYKAVVTAKLLELAHELNVETIAEGVETLEELAWLREAGATYVQGYLIGKPAPVKASEEPALVG